MHRHAKTWILWSLVLVAVPLSSFNYSFAQDTTKINNADQRLLLSSMEQAARSGNKHKLSSDIADAHSQGYFAVEDRGYGLAVKRFPQDIQWGLSYSQSLINREEFSQAAATLSASAKACAQTNPAKFEEFLKESLAQIQILQTKKRYNDSLVFLDCALKLRPKDESLHTARAWSFWFLGKPVVAFREIRKSIEFNPKNKDLPKIRQNFLSAMKYSSLTVERISQEMKIDGDDPDLHLVLSYRFLTKGDNLTALDQVMRAAKGSLIDNECLLLKARILVELHRFSEASKVLDGAIAQNSNIAANYVVRGVCNHAMGRSKEAENDLREACRLAPNDPDCHYTYARILFDSGRTADALSEIDRAIVLGGKTISYRATKTHFLIGLGEYDDALQLIAINLKISPRNANLHNQRAHALCALGHYENALTEIATALKLDPDKVDYRNLKSEILHLQQIRKMPPSELLQSLKSHPIDQNARNLFFDTWSKQKRFADASSLLTVCAENAKTVADAISIGNQCSSLVNNGAAALAMAPLTKLIERFPNNFDLYLSRCAAFCALKNAASAVKDARSCLHLPGSPMTKSDIFCTRMNSMRPTTVAQILALDELIHYADQLTSSDPDRIAVIGQRAKYTEAEESLILDITHSSPQESGLPDLDEQAVGGQRVHRLPESLYAGLGNWFAKSSNYSRAFAWVSCGLKAYPKSVKLLETKATLEEALGRKKEAVMDVKAVQRAGSNSFTEDSAKARSRTLMRELPSFVNSYGRAGNEALSRAMKIQKEKILSLKDPHARAEAYLALAQLNIVAKHYSEVIENINEVLKIDRNITTAYEVQSWAYQATGDLERARQARRMAVLTHMHAQPVQPLHETYTGQNP
jgi:tetratricopeptide (TPR) repeat protein